MDSIVYKPIGYVKSPYTNREDMPRFYKDSGEVTAKLE
jgi:tRNA (Thr-GGU) A37 N-methylase